MSETLRASQEQDGGTASDAQNSEHLTAAEEGAESVDAELERHEAELEWQTWGDGPGDDLDWASTGSSWPD